MTQQVQKTKGLRIATRCGSLAQFVEVFHRFCDGDSVFISTLAQRPVGLETAFSIDLSDGNPALRGLGIVLDSWPTADNRFGRPGLRIGVRRLTTDSVRVMHQLQQTRTLAQAAAPDEPVAAAPPPAHPSPAAPPAATPSPVTPPAVTLPPVTIVPPRRFTPPPIPRLAKPGTESAVPVPTSPIATKPLVSPITPKLPATPAAAAMPKPGLSPTAFAAKPAIPSVIARAPADKPAPPPVAAEMPSVIVEPEVAPAPAERAEPTWPPPVAVEPAPPAASAESATPTWPPPVASIEPPPPAAPPPVAPPPAAPPPAVTAAEPPPELPTPPVVAASPPPPDEPPATPATVIDAPTERHDSAPFLAPPADTVPPPMEARAPGSELVLPANPLMGINDESLEGFVDCTIYEETGNFFPADPSTLEEPGDAAAEPPLLSPLSRPPRAQSPAVDADEPAHIVAPSLAQLAGEPPVMPAPMPGADALPGYPLGQPPLHPLPPDAPPSFAPSNSPPAYLGAPAYPVATPYDHALASPGAYPPATPVPAVADDPSRGRATAGEIVLPRGGVIDRRWLIIGGIAIVVLIIIIAVATGRSHASRSIAAATPPPTTAPAPRAPAPPPAAAPTADPADPADPPPTEVAGMPVVGAGPCRMTIQTTPAGSTVQLDGQMIGPSPLVVDGPCQKRELAIDHPRYAAVSRTVVPTAGKPTTVDVTLQRPVHDLMIETQPAGAAIAIAGRSAGTSPTLVKIMGFSTITITVAKPGFAPVTKHVYSKVPKDRLFVRLDRAHR